MDVSEPSLPRRLSGVPAPRLQSAFAALEAQGLFSGQVLVKVGDDAVFRGAFGQASREYGAPNTPGTRFNMASLGKMLTATLVGSLIDDGKLGLGDTVDQHLGDDWIDPEIAARLTIAMLLSHTAGLTNPLASMIRYNPAVLRTLDAIKPFVRQAKLAAEPGKTWAYSNTGFELLGALCERVAGMAYWDAVQARILAPAGMTSTGRREATDTTRADAQAYAVLPRSQPPADEAALRSAPFDVAANSRPLAANARDIAAQGFTLANMTPLLAPSTASGGGYTTADDLGRFLAAFDGGTLVRPATRALLLAPQPLSDVYRLGFALLHAAQRGYGHVGGSPGVDALAISYADGGRLVLLTNLDRAASVGLATLSDLATAP